MEAEMTRTEGMYEDHIAAHSRDLEIGIRYFREYAKRGLQRVAENDIEGALLDMDRAVQANSSQPLQQRGMLLYCVGNYSEAARQIERDVYLLEKMKVSKAVELRLWLTAAYYKLGLVDQAKNALDIENKGGFRLEMESYLMNQTLLFYRGDYSIEDMIDLVGTPIENDRNGLRFYGNFYMSLHFDSINATELCETFLNLVNINNRYSPRDMWYQIPRLLYDNRFKANA